jgi:hypothetical protein
MPAMLVVPVSLNQISGARASTRSDQCAFPTTDHGAANSADTGADQRAFGSAVVHPVIAAISPLSICTNTSESAE